MRDERSWEAPAATRHDARPTLGHIAGYMLDTLFMDGLYNDLERVTRINMLLDAAAGGRRPGPLAGLGRVETLVVLPGEDLREMAARFAGEMPLTVRLLLRGLGAYGRGGGQLISYLLFERGFTGALIDLGFEDAMARRDHILALFRGDPMPAIDAPERVAADLSGQFRRPDFSGLLEEDPEDDRGTQRAAH